MMNKIYSSKISKKKILILSIPIFFSNVAIPLVGIVDTGLMGNLEETKFLAATSIGTSIMTMIIWSFGFLRMGTVGIVAQLFARSDFREISKTLLRNFLLAILISVVLILLKPLLIVLAKDFFSLSTETHSLVKTYISIRVLSAPGELIIYILIGFFLGIQKTKISSLFIIFFSILNIVLSSYFVLSLNLDVFGVALGTLIASYFTAGIFSFYTYNFIRKKFNIVITFNNLINLNKIYKLITINFDIFLRTVFLTFSFLWISYLGSKLGEDYLAVNAILIQFLILAAFFLDAYAFSTEGVVGYTVGRRNQKNFLLVTKHSIELSFFSAIIISILYFIFFKQIINIITDIEILRFISYQHAVWIIIIPPVAAFCYQLDGIFIGASQTKELRNAMMVSVSSFIVLSVYLTKFFGNHGLWFSLLIFMILRSLTLIYNFNKILKKF